MSMYTGKDHHTDVLGYLDSDGVPPDLTFSEMVKNLFKVDLPGNQAPLLHAAVGIIGEVAEFAGATTLHNTVEELGDLEFYLEAAWQQLDRRSPLETASEMSLAEAHHILLLLSGDLLDVAKKAWVYNKPVGQELAAEILQSFDSTLRSIYPIFGLERYAVIRQNMVKLVGKSGRYTSGKYSNEAAIARADKPAGE